MKIGDSVQIEGGAGGVVVGLIGQGVYAAGFAADDWTYLVEGVLIQADDAGLMHYAEPDAAWVLLARAA